MGAGESHTLQDVTFERPWGGRSWGGQRGKGSREGRGGDRTDGGVSADFAGGVCWPQQPLSCFQLARPLPLSPGLSFLACKQDSKISMATPRPLIFWSPSLWTGAPILLVGQEPQSTFPHVPACWAHVLVFSSQVGSPGCRMEGATCPRGQCTEAVPGRGR